MRAPIAFCALALALTLISTAEAASNPIPGVGIVVKRNRPGSSSAFSGPGLPAIPAGFFGPGSAPFSGVVGLQGQCSQNCGGCDDDCDGDADDSRIDYVENTDTGILATAMARAFLYSTAPIEVAVNGVPSFFDVFVEISGVAPGSTVPGSLQLPPGVSLVPGSSAVVASSSCDLHARYTFADATTGAAVGQAIETDLHLVLQESSLPIVRLADGTAAGRIVLGLDGSTAVPFTYASAGGALILQVKSRTEAPVGVEGATWGTVKGLFR